MRIRTIYCRATRNSKRSEKLTSQIAELDSLRAVSTSKFCPSAVARAVFQPKLPEISSFIFGIRVSVLEVQGAGWCLGCARTVDKLSQCRHRKFSTPIVVLEGKFIVVRLFGVVFAGKAQR